MTRDLKPAASDLPLWIYGTAWKEERSADLVAMALAAGFRAIDTANQRKHYHEVGVGEGLARAGIPRHELFVQSKFTYQRGQDHRLPYDPGAPLPTQVLQSFTSSLEHLGTDYLDSYLLHGPASNEIWSDEDRTVWSAMEELEAEGRTRAIGVSNVSLTQLEMLIASAKTPPRFVQNRCYARYAWDKDVRALCSQHGIVYQGFSLLTANRQELASPSISAMAARLGATIPQLVFRFAQGQGILPLTGTSTREHMDLDLACDRLQLSPADLQTIETISG